MEFASRIAAVLADKPEERAIEFQGAWYLRGEVHLLAQQLDAILGSYGLGAGARIGLIARNRPPHISAFAGLVATRRRVVMIYSAQSGEAIAENVRTLNLAAVVADRQDWTNGVVDAARESGALGLELTHERHEPVGIVHGLDEVGSAVQIGGDPNVAMELLSSGTTGAPKRVPLLTRTFEEAVRDAAATYASGKGEDEHRPNIVFQPLGNIAGVTFIIPFLMHGSPIALLERFALQPWLDAVRRHRPARASLPPAVLRTLLDERIPKADLASLASIGVGAAPLDPLLQEQFEQTYDIPLLPGYGATEYCGVIANWTMALHREFGVAKRGSVGRPRPGVSLRVVDPETGAELPTGSIGVLEARVLRVGDEWIHTTDLARVDADGFLYLHGRADSAINRGGFKILPDEVARVLRAHPAIADAAVIGMPDSRLGQVPHAAVELRKDVAAPSAAEIEAFARARLIPYQVPVRTVVLPELPRNPSMKVDLPKLRRLLEREEDE